MSDLLEALLYRPNFIAFVILFLWGFYIMVIHPNLVKKLIGLYIVQTSVILFLVAFSAKTGATVPIVPAEATVVEASNFTNPLPHVLMLTAIVVSVAVTGVALAFLVRIHREFNDDNEETILEKLGHTS